MPMVQQTRAPESRFAYVVVAARRARQLMSGAPPMVVNPHSQKPTRVAMEELQGGTLEFDIPPVPVGPTAAEEAKRRSG
jgi:DNA-directed RNA polymerase omega subunit